MATNWSQLVLERLAGSPRTIPVAVEDSPASAAWWRTDLPASLIIFVIAVPLCLGIALASGAPLFSGIIAGIIGATVVGALSGSPLMISGPAAGLSAISMTAIAAMGSFRAFLAVVVVAGVLQLGLAVGRVGIVGYYFPSTVVRGMLMAIGLILILKQIPHALGSDVDFEGDEAFLQANAENTFSAIVTAVTNIDYAALLLSVLGLAILVLWNRAPTLARRVPGSLVVVAAGMAGHVLLPLLSPTLRLGPEHLVGLPVPTVAGGSEIFATPDWSALLRFDAWRFAVALALVASLETLLTLEATDKIDPFKREAPPDRELAAQGVGNILAGLVGGLPVAGVLVRSAANVDAGATTKASAIMHGVLLAAAVFLFPRLFNLIPLASLAAVLMYTGSKLARPSTVKLMWDQGYLRFVPFATTVGAILLTDLLIGILVGLAVGVVFVLFDQLRYPCFTVVSGPGSVLKRVRLHDQVSYLNKASLSRFLNALPPHSRIEIDGSSCRHIDQDVLEFISDFRRTAVLRHIDFRIVGVTLPPVSPSH